MDSPYCSCKLTRVPAPQMGPRVVRLTAGLQLQSLWRIVTAAVKRSSLAAAAAPTQLCSQQPPCVVRLATTATHPPPALFPQQQQSVDEQNNEPYFRPESTHTADCSPHAREKLRRRGVAREVNLPFAADLQHLAGRH